uniref:Uncharacterized protein n=1 Tax=Rhizophora mucronata TaxID=61149 RepID=A0A2P2KRT6_RHIMU
MLVAPPEDFCQVCRRVWRGKDSLHKLFHGKKFIVVAVIPKVAT